MKIEAANARYAFVTLVPCSASRAADHPLGAWRTPRTGPCDSPRGPTPAHRQCSCHHIRTETERYEIRAAVRARKRDAEQLLRDFSAAAERSLHPDGKVWAQALTWAAARLHGGHASLHADETFEQRFGTHPDRSAWAQPDRPS
ncbi:hypothetical protein [Streptomyces massasporeus]|uniref:hypothetical protein n=1 Tax=Streptomyces massasporeus TaxID=67324 RepID=UPI0036E5F9F4